MKKTAPILPSTVVDQIRLWEMERNRLRATPGTLFQGFREQEYKEVLEYASDFGYVLWKSDLKKTLVLTSDGHDNVRSWLKEKSKNIAK